MNRWIDRAIVVLLVVAGVTMPLALWMAFLYAPDEKVLGAVQRIIFFHVPSALMTYAAVVSMLIGSIAYLRTRDMRWDYLSRASIDLALLFCTIVIVTGPIWARPAWGTWWTWEARLTSTLILWLLLIGCLIVRSYATDRDLAARLTGVLGIVCAIDVFIIHKAVEWWRGQHPDVFKTGESNPMDPRMVQTLLTCMAVFFLLYLLLLALRYRTVEVEDRYRTTLERMTESET